MENLSLSEAIEAVLEIARWAPSGDNAQPWSFRIAGSREVEVLVRRTSSSVYEYRRGEPTLISVGALVENIQIAAPAYGLEAGWRYAGSKEGVDHIFIYFSDASVPSKPELLDYIKTRSVDRRRFKIRRLTVGQKQLLCDTLGSELSITWSETFAQRRQIAGLSALATKIRLTIPETFSIHRNIVDWENKLSQHAIPSRALGLDPLTLKLTRWSMASWRRTRFMNALGAPYFASLQMDVLPGLSCGAYFAIHRERTLGPLANVVDSIRAGQRIQRFWLMATKLGLVVQPCVAILAFWGYGATGEEFTVCPKAARLAGKLASRAPGILGNIDEVVFLGRIGLPISGAPARSIRLPLETLFSSAGLEPRFA